MKTILVSLIAFLSALNLAAQMNSAPVIPGSKGAGVITGNVNESVEKSAMEWVNIILYKSPDSSLVTGTVTNAKGEFILNNVPNGRYYLQINFMGYEKKILNLEISPDRNSIDFGVIQLEPKTVGLTEINIEGEKNYVQYKIDKKVINVAKNLNATGGTAVDALRNVPSVNVDADGNVTIRGNSNFTVLIDGRPTSLNATDVLRQTPASSIENIEVITNPSVKYDPNGTSGIINIIMKKQTMNGTNGIINTMAGTNEKYNIDFLMNYRKDKWNFFVGAGSNQRTNPQESNIDRSDFIGALMDTTKRLLVISNRTYIPHGYNVKAGADYLLNDKTTFSFSGEAGGYGFDRIGLFKNQIWTEPGASSTYYIVDDKFLLNGLYINGTLNFQKKFEKPGHELNANILYSIFDATRNNDQERKSTDANWNPTDIFLYKYRTINDVLKKTIVAKADYIQPFSETSKLEAGYQGDYNFSSLLFQLDNFNNTTSTWISDPSWASNYSINQQIHAVYGTYSNTFKKIEYQAGIRGEYLTRDLTTQTGENDFYFELFTLYPSLHFSYPLPLQQSLQLSYSKRVQRPEDWMLNPFPNFSDGQFTSKGNAKLKPSNTDAVEMSYMKNFKSGNISSTAFYRYNTNVVSQMFYWNNGNFLTVWDNIGTNITSGLEIMSNYRFTKWLSVNLSGSCFYDELHIRVTDTSNSNSYNVNYNVQLSPKIDLKTETSIQITAAYNGPNNFGIGWSEPTFMLDAAVKQNFFKQKLIVSLRAGNLTGSKFKVTVKDPRYQIKQIVYPEQFAITLNVSYKINNYTRSNRQGSNVRFEGGL